MDNDALAVFDRWVEELNSVSRELDRQQAEQLAKLRPSSADRAAEISLKHRGTRKIG